MLQRQGPTDTTAKPRLTQPRSPDRHNRKAPTDTTTKPPRHNFQMTTTDSPRTGSPCPDASSVDELLSPVRHIQPGIFDSPSMNTRSSAQKQRGDDHATEDNEEEQATIKSSYQNQKEIRKMTDDELFMSLVEGITRLPSCIPSDLNIWECVAKYLVQFERKNKYDQDCIILEWYKYAIATRTGKYLWFCLPFDATWTINIDCVRASQAHKLCSHGMCSLLGIGPWRYGSPSRRFSWSHATT